MLGYLPYSQNVTVVTKDSTLDKWGKPIVSNIETVYNCYVRETTAIEQQYDSKELVSSLVFGIEGNVSIKAGNTVIYCSDKYDVAKTRKIRDLSGEVITTLVYV